MDKVERTFGEQAERHDDAVNLDRQCNEFGDFGIESSARAEALLKVLGLQPGGDNRYIVLRCDIMFEVATNCPDL